MMTVTVPALTWVLLIALWLPVPRASGASETDLAMEPPVINTDPGPKYSDEQRDYAMVIGMDRTPKGRIWAAWVAGGDSDLGYFVAASSDDNGRTWSKPRLVIDPPAAPSGLRRRILVGNFWTDPTGRLWLFFDQSMGYFDGRGGSWAITCDNPDSDKPVWSAPRRLWHGATLNKPLVLKNGEWLMPISLWTRDRIGPAQLRDGFKELDDLRMANLFVSTDQGTTWNRRGGVRIPYTDFDEHMFVELKDGRLWLLARTKYGIAESYSSDAGRTWTEPKPSSIQNVSARFFLRRLASGNLLLVKNGPLGIRLPSRSHMMAFLSEDDGKTWKGGLMIDERDGVSYPDGFQSPDGTIRILYDRNRAKNREILMGSFTEADVLAGKPVSTNATLMQLVSKALGPSLGKETHRPKPVPVKILFDTDMQTDCDDAAALAVLHALARRGEAELLATVVSVKDPTSVATVDAINTFYGRTNLPTGYVSGPGVMEKSRYTGGIARDFPNRFASGSTIPDAAQVYRDVLEQQPDHSVTIVTVGYLTNLRNLLQLPANDRHPSGMDLVKSKVKQWVCMGGNFIGNPPQDDLKLGNVNFQRDGQSARDVIATWPGTVVFAGREVCSVPSGLLIGDNLSWTPTNNPVRRAYSLYFDGQPRKRHVADLAAVLFAVRGARDYWDVSEPGTMHLKPDITFDWQSSPVGRRRYLLKKSVNRVHADRYVEAALGELLITPPR